MDVVVLPTPPFWFATATMRDMAGLVLRDYDDLKIWPRDRVQRTLYSDVGHVCMSSKERQCLLEFHVFILRLPSSSARSCVGWIRCTRLSTIWSKSASRRILIL